jgi:phosphoribosylaminoimidazole carboxylase (NCAIR synthetase)
MPEGPLRIMMQTYGKSIRPGRKLGHLTLLGSDSEAVRALRSTCWIPAVAQTLQ